MLLSHEAESRIKGILGAVGSAISTYLIGRNLAQTRTEALSSAIGLRNRTSLEQSYLAGRAASQLGDAKLKNMSADELEQWLIHHPITLTEAEQAQIKALRTDTERWVEGRTADWQKMFNQVLSKHDQEWRARLTESNDPAAHTTARNAALKELAANLRNESSTFVTDVGRLIQTETHRYFQQGQAAGWDPDDLVYKLPRAEACPNCMRLHLNADGSPRLYKLADVLGNSNVGRKSYDWDFTIGPTHPWCYCILHSAANEEPGPDPERAKTRATALGKATPAEPETLVRLQKHTSRPEELAPHHQLLLAELEKLYAD
jgi:hypothetical protein